MGSYRRNVVFHNQSTGPAEYFRDISTWYWYWYWLVSSGLATSIHGFVSNIWILCIHQQKTPCQEGSVINLVDKWTKSPAEMHNQKLFIILLSHQFLNHHHILNLVSCFLKTEFRRDLNFEMLIRSCDIGCLIIHLITHVWWGNQKVSKL